MHTMAIKIAGLCGCLLAAVGNRLVLQASTGRG